MYLDTSHFAVWMIVLNLHTAILTNRLEFEYWKRFLNAVNHTQDKTQSNLVAGSLPLFFFFFSLWNSGICQRSLATLRNSASYSTSPERVSENSPQTSWSWLKLEDIIKLLTTIDSPLFGRIIEDEFFFFSRIVQSTHTQGKNFTIKSNMILSISYKLSCTELIIKLMNSRNFSVNSHLLKFVSLWNDLRNNLLSNLTDDTCNDWPL